jgi:hypothetical protein
MKTADVKQVAVGFLTVVEHQQHGLFGGYLILNGVGRPLEFHCTAPVKPNRAQEILYGPTLVPYLYGEQIGQVLVQKSTHEPELICTDLSPMLTVRNHVEVPVLLVLSADTSGVEETFSWGRNCLATVRGNPQDREVAERLFQSLSEVLDLAEPFGRIREAIDEAERAGRPRAA